MLNGFIWGALVVALVWFGSLVAKHGWSWVSDKLKARALKAEADLRLKANQLAGAFEPRIQAIEADLAAIKAKLNLTPPSAG